MLTQFVPKLPAAFVDRTQIPWAEGVITGTRLLRGALNFAEAAKCPYQMIIHYDFNFLNF